MSVEKDKERAWSRLVTPILWPVLVLQVVLVGLWLIVGLSGRWLVLSPASWGDTVWWLLVLAIGSGLNVTAFLMLLRQRIRSEEARVEAAFARLGERLRAGGGDDASGAGRLDATHLPLERRLEAVAESCDAMAKRWQAEIEAVRGVERRLNDDLQAQRGQLMRLETGRVRAQEESRLKSDYLSHLQQMLRPLMDAVSEVLQGERWKRPDGDDERAAIEGLQERLAETAVLLENLGDADATGAPTGPPATVRVLVVDDGPVNLMLARKVLEGQGVEVVTATSGREALDSLETTAFDLVFLDIYMADMDGVETCRAWRAREAERGDGARSVMVALTANAGEADRQRFREAGMDDYLAKPYRPQDLLDRVHHWLPGRLLRENDA
ncbi:response regulator [Halomonas getboli]|uniref:response regulator n=1 Tax=Halomonas getboli TaxID=2935862 RepID=UPI001FFFCA44|nr:response regulator [Halomonas getboli]MCK2184408.1 response regulator [Halomonas getboli]